MKLTLEINPRLISRRAWKMAVLSLICVAAVWGISYAVRSAYDEQQQQRASARFAACMEAKDKFIADHRFDTLIREQAWIMAHPDDPRLRWAPHGRELAGKLSEPDAVSLDQVSQRQPGDDYYENLGIEPLNRSLMNSLEHLAGKDNLTKSASQLGYSLRSEDAKGNVNRAFKFAKVFSPYSDTLRTYARGGEDPNLRIVIASDPFLSCPVK